MIDTTTHRTLTELPADRYGYEDLPQLMSLMTGDEKHSPSATSTLDVLWTLYDRVLVVDPDRPDLVHRDRFLLSKGHGPMAFYAVLAAKRFVPVEWLPTFGEYDSPAVVKHLLDGFRRANPRADFYQSMLYLELRLRLPELLLMRVDKISMSTSVEARVPFLDHRIVEWAAGVPDEKKIRGSETKLILREAFGDRLPREVLERPKRGFDLPLAAWIRGPLRPLAEDLLSPEHLGKWIALRPEQVRKLLELHLRRRQDFGLPLFNLLSIMLFLDRWGAA